jgi:hypothetical protein
VTELIVASGPLRYLGGSIETFALPMGTFIVAAWVLFAIYRRPHNVPRLKYLRPAHQVALGTREPGEEGLVYVASASAASATAAPEAVTEAEAPAEADTQAETEAPAEADAQAETEAEAPAEADAQAKTEAEAPAGTEAEALAVTQADATVEAHAVNPGSATADAGPEASADAEHDGTSAEGETF